MWEYKGKPFIADDNTRFDYFGFIYQIDYTDGTSYIGRKEFTKMKSKSAPKNEKTVQKYLDDGYTKRGFNKNGKRHYKYVKFTESDWRTYNGSSKLTKDKTIERKTILRLCEQAIDLTYWEAHYLMANDVLFRDDFLNQCVASYYYAGKLTGSKTYIKE